MKTDRRWARVNTQLQAGWVGLWVDRWVGGSVGG